MGIVEETRRVLMKIADLKIDHVKDFDFEVVLNVEEGLYNKRYSLIFKLDYDRNIHKILDNDHFKETNLYQNFTIQRDLDSNIKINRELYNLECDFDDFIRNEILIRFGSLRYLTTNKGD